MDYRDPRDALRAKKQALEQALHETDAQLDALEAPAQAKPPPRDAARGTRESLVVAVLGLALVALGIWGALEATKMFRAWAFEHAPAVSGPDTALEGRLVTVTARIDAAEPAADDEFLSRGDEVALDRVVEVGRWHGAYRGAGPGGRGLGPLVAAGRNWKQVDDALGVASKSWRAAHVKVGGYDVDLERIGALPLESLDIDAGRARKQVGAFAWDGRTFAAPVSSEPEGDVVRVTHRALRRGALVTVFGRQRGQRLVPLESPHTRGDRDAVFMVAGEREAGRRALVGQQPAGPEIAVWASYLCIVLGCVVVFSEGTTGSRILAAASVGGLVAGLGAFGDVVGWVLAAGSLATLLTLLKKLGTGRGFLLIVLIVTLLVATELFRGRVAASPLASVAVVAAITGAIGLLRHACGWHRQPVAAGEWD